MHVPTKWDMGSVQRIHQFINEYGFASIISKDLNSSITPLILDSNEGDYGVLYGHFARSNQHSKTINGQSVLTIFSGPHSYISPSWYAAAPAVPTWNYAAVHAQGVLEFLDAAETISILDKTIAKYEPGLQPVIPEDYKAKLVHGIVGFKIVLTQLEGKEKLGQHRSLADQQGISAALKDSTNPGATELYAYMRAHNIGQG